MTMAIGVSVVLAAYPALFAHDAAGLLTLGLVAPVLLGVSLVWNWHSGVVWALGILGAEFVVSVYIRGESLDLIAAVFGSALLLTAELAYWSLERRTHCNEETGLVWRRLRAMALLVACSLGVGLLEVVFVDLSGPGSLALLAVGVSAAVLSLGMVALLTRRLRQ